MSAISDKILRNVRPHERERCLIFSAVLALLSFALTLGMAGSEALFIARVGIEALPIALIVASFLTVGGSLLYAFLVGRWRNDTLFCGMLVGFGALLLASVPYLSSSDSTIYAVFCVYCLGNALLYNHFWTWADEYFDSTSAKRLFPLFAIASSLGGVLGGAVGQLFNNLWGPNSLILGWAIFTFLTALLLHSTQRSLRSWSSLSVGDGEDSAWESLKRALQYLHTSPLSRWLSISALAMVLGLFISQYLYQSIIAQAFPDARDLASFMNYYLIASNALEIVVEGLVLPACLIRLGIPRTNIIHPLCTIMSLLGMALCPGLYSAIAARLNRELLDSALAAPVRTLMYNALPARLRGHMRAFLEGVVIYAGMAAAGLFLQIGQKYSSTTTLIAVGLATSLVYLLANCWALKHYLRTMVGSLREGRFVWDGLSAEFSAYEIPALSKMWQTLTTSGQVPAPTQALQLAEILARLNASSELISQIGHPCPGLRRAIAKALPLASRDFPQILGALMVLSEDREAQVVCQSLRSFQTIFSRDSAPAYPPQWQSKLAALRQHENPQVRALAAALSGELGDSLLDQMASSEEESCVRAALEVSDATQAQRLLSHLHSPIPALRGLAFSRLVELSCPLPLSVEELGQIILQEERQNSETALRALGNLGSDSALALLASHLSSPKHALRRRASEQLTRHPQKVLPWLEPYLNHEDPYAVEAAITTLGACTTAAARQMLLSSMRGLARSLWEARLSLEVVLNSKSPSHCLAYWQIALEDYIHTIQSQLQQALTYTASASTVTSLAHELKRTDSPLYGQALEILSNLEDHEATRLLVLYYEQAPLASKLPALSSSITRPQTLDDVISWSQRINSPWLRQAIAKVSHKENPMDNLLTLRQVSLFKDMTLAQLSAIAKLLRESEYLSGEVIFKEGEMGTDLYLLIGGSVEVIKDYQGPKERHLTTLQAVNYFGEMAILDDEPRSATIVAAEDTTLLSLNGEAFKELIRDMPDISFEVMRVLTQRIRNVEKRS